MAEERERCLKAGMRDHITKPIDPDALYRTLKSWHRGNGSAATAPAAAPKAPTPPVPDLAGIDTAGALARVAGNAALYRSLLGQFVRQQDGVETRIRDALSAGDRPTAERLAHTLKGVSGNLGAGALTASAAALEAALRSDATPAAIEPLLQAAARDLAVVLQTVRSGLGLDAPVETVAASPAEVLPLLDRLDALLSSDDGDALTTFLDIRDRLGAAAASADLDALQTDVENFDFTAALATSARIRAALGEGRHA